MDAQAQGLIFTYLFLTRQAGSTPAASTIRRTAENPPLILFPMIGGGLVLLTAGHMRRKA